ncbi:MAG TPA: hypothetical protein VFQ61_15165, partial [Polyangiaceae bacterium]|nr:hypothetical protein [Polyangiaceae bacterium]
MERSSPLVHVLLVIYPMLRQCCFSLGKRTLNAWRGAILLSVLGVSACRSQPEAGAPQRVGTPPSAARVIDSRDARNDPNAATDVRALSRPLNSPSPSGDPSEANSKEPRVGAESNSSEARVEVPPAKSSQPMPFLLILHGLGGSGEQMAQVLNLKTFAQEKQFAYATPDGTPDSMGRRFW